MYSFDTPSWTTLSSADFTSILFENDFKALLPEIFLVIASIIILVYGVIGSTSSGYPLLIGNISWLALFSLIITFSLINAAPLSCGYLFYNSLVQDDYTFFLRSLLILGAIFSICISLNYVKSEGLNSFELNVLILLSTASMMFLICSADFISMYLAIEMLSLCFYVMAALKRNSEFSSEAGLKYFLLGAFSSGLLLLGCSLIYGFTGCTEFGQLGKIFSCGGSGGVYTVPQLGLVFIIVGFLFKCTAVPFHMWAPDVYEGAPTAVTAFFSIAPKIALFGVFARVFLWSFYDFMFPWQKMLIFSSLASMILGALAAMSQNKMKRLLAYSSIGHVGYLLVGFCCGTVEGIQALLIYLTVYIAMTINLFAIIQLNLARHDTHSGVSLSPWVQRVKYTTDLAQLASTNPLLALSLGVTMFSIAGIPPLAGFYSKAALFFAAVSCSQYLLAVFGVITSVVSCFYYIRLVKIMYFEKSRMWCSFNEIPKTSSLALAITFIFIVTFMMYPAPLYLVTHKCALALFF
jgi:proton-translocating NADH-quinone oxidoreductase chain N